MLRASAGTPVPSERADSGCRNLSHWYSLVWAFVAVMKTTFLLFASTLIGMPVLTGAADPLPSWNDTGPRKAVIAFVEKVTREGSPDFVPVPERIATFDNDGTLWSEQPMYFQLLFALDRVKAL